MAMRYLFAAWACGRAKEASGHVIGDGFGGLDAGLDPAGSFLGLHDSSGGVSNGRSRRLALSFWTMCMSCSLPLMGVSMSWEMADGVQGCSESTKLALSCRHRLSSVYERRGGLSNRFHRVSFPDWPGLKEPF
jgi:hypothetical protein